MTYTYFQMACKPPGQESNTGKKILEKLTKYSWDAKAVLTLAAFALDYGDFWLLAHLHASDKSAKWVGILKGVPTIVTESWLQKHKLAIIKLDQLIKSTVEAIDCILVLEGLSDRYAEEDLQELSEAMYYIPLDVYYAIITVVACTTQMCCLINDEGKPEELSLSSFSLKITATVDSLNLVIKRTKEIIAKLEDYGKLVKIMNNPRKITVVFNEMGFTSLVKQQVNLKEIETENVFLFFSDLDISENEISILNSIDNNKSMKDQYKIIWIPIVDWTVDQMQTKFEKLRSKMPNTWYRLPKFSFDLGIQYIKEKWEFKNRPIVVVMNSQGKVVHRDAYHMIALGINPLRPITGVPDSPLPNGEDSVGQILLGSLHIDILTWMKQEKYIFFYGGKDTVWIKQFKEQVYAMNQVFKPASISIELFYVEDKGEITLWKFWNGIESFFLGWNYIKNILLSGKDKKTESSTVMSTILKLLSYKTESTEWVVLCKGSKLVESGHGTTILKVLKKYDPPCTIPITPTFDFASSFLNYHREILKLPAEKPGCYHFDIAEDAGKITAAVMCPFCSDRMKLSSRFNCCHSAYRSTKNVQH
ncbi:protein SIEVE ELEMENT OCCLUSION B-like [Quercus robur]|uniref:protein SIEVE ELEMENT OCCLUSION B-like n=1 Tax=Quercus robur TaxID=38942 RepID=UPI002162B1E2|nr:protein SIEVE ELEMENT OCCLUSION B-like [Quercus robur]